MKKKKKNVLAMASSSFLRPVDRFGFQPRESAAALPFAKRQVPLLCSSNSTLGSDEERGAIVRTIGKMNHSWKPKDPKIRSRNDLDVARADPQEPAGDWE
jgi:hypothetical protein